MNIKFKKCQNCNTIVKIIENCNCENCGIKCCGLEMLDMPVNSKDFSFEKHIPTYKIENNKIKVSVNHVMEEKHYIKWILLTNELEEHIKYLKPNDIAYAEFDYIENGILYAYCNNHGLWKVEINNDLASN